MSLNHLCVFLLLLQTPQTHGMSGWGGCLDGQDVFAAVRENSPPVILSPEVFGDWSEDSFSWMVRGKDADWFFMDGINLWLNTSAEKVLDRETEGAFLVAELVCYEQDTLQSVYRIVVEILNENDNIPIFVDGPVQSAIISELTPVNAIVFKVQATDADNDVIKYSIDQDSPDAQYFKVVVPSSGEVVLAKPLDYETKTLLSLVVHASEMSTAEQHSRSAQVSITVQDGDDQYPHFLPCTVLSHVCLNPTYTANVTQGQQDLVLSFSPGPIHAVDGDRGLSSSISYVILSGNDEGHFQINRHSGEMSLTEGFSDRLSSPVRHLQVMAFQEDDPRKYSVVAVEVCVVAQNQFPPVFERSQYWGFVSVGAGSAALVQTYGDRELVLTVTDQDFNQSVNPRIVLSLSPSANHTSDYSVTKEGLLIANTGHMVPGQRHAIQVKALDQESGETSFTTVTVEVLAEGQTVPSSERSSDRLSGCVVGKAFFVCLLVLALGLCVFYLCLWIRRRLQDHDEPQEGGGVAQGKHPNVVSQGGARPLTEDLPFNTEDCGTSNPSFSDFDQDNLSHHGAPSSYDQTLNSYDQAPSSYDQAPISYDQAPSSYVQAPSSYDQTPISYDQAPISYDQTLNSYDQAPSSYDQAPSSYDQAPISYDQAPISYDQTPISYDQAPISYDQAPISYDQTPISNDQTPSSYDQTPSSYDQAPSSYNQAPISYDQAPISYDQTPISNDQTPSSYDQAPISNDQTPISNDQTPSSYDQAPIANDQAPSSYDQAPISNDQTPISYDQPPHTCDQASSQDTEKMSLETLPCDSPLVAAEACPAPSPHPPSSSSPPSPSSPVQLHSRRLVEAQIDKPLYKVTTPPTGSSSHHSPEELLPVHSVEQAAEGQQQDGRGEREPCTSLDNSDNSESHGEQSVEVFRGSVSPELLSDEEELLNVLERCYPVIITFRK